MQTDIWGPHLWEYLHTLTFNYPITPSNNHKIYYKQFFDNLQYTLPCSYCRESFSIIYKIFNIDKFLDDRHGITFWLFCIHNIINIKLNKNIVSFDFVVNKYENIRASSSDKIDINQFVTFSYNKYNQIIKKYVRKFIKINDQPVIYKIISNSKVY